MNQPLLIILFLLLVSCNSTQNFPNKDDKQSSVSKSNKKSENVIPFSWPNVAVPNGSFTIGVIGDTQSLSTNKIGKEYLIKMMQFFTTKREELNLLFIASLGDHVLEGNDKEQWARVSEAYNILESSNIPYVPVHGNRDSMNKLESYTNNELYRKQYPVDGYLKSYMAGYQGGTENSYYLFEDRQSKTEFLVLTLRFGANELEKAWGNKILKQHRNRHVIMATHLRQFDSLIANNENVFLSLNGHIASRRSHEMKYNSFGQERHFFQFDYSSPYKEERTKNTEAAVIRWFTFHPANDQICMKTFSILTNSFVTENNVCNGTWDTTECNELCWNYKM